MTQPLTESQLEHMRGCLKIATKHCRTDSSQPVTLWDWYVCQVTALLTEVERLSDQVSSCWIILDALAHEPTRGSYGLAAERLLRQQQAPGWKGPGQ